MNNLLSYCGLVATRISASEKDLPVQNVCSEALKLWKYKEVQTTMDLPEFNFVQDFDTFD